MKLLINKYTRAVFHYFRDGYFGNLFRRSHLGRDGEIIHKFNIDPETLLRIKQKIYEDNQEPK